MNNTNSSPLSLNLNTILLTGVLGLTGWTLYTVSGQSAISAGQAEQLRSHDKEIQEIQTKINNAEADLVLLKIDLAEIKSRK